jgi:hypothetical protein
MSTCYSATSSRRLCPGGADRPVGAIIEPGPACPPSISSRRRRRPLRPLPPWPQAWPAAPPRPLRAEPAGCPTWLQSGGRAEAGEATRYRRGRTRVEELPRTRRRRRAHDCDHPIARQPALIIAQLITSSSASDQGVYVYGLDRVTARSSSFLLATKIHVPSFLPALSLAFFSRARSRWSPRVIFRERAEVLGAAEVLGV